MQKGEILAEDPNKSKKNDRRKTLAKGLSTRCKHFACKYFLGLYTLRVQSVESPKFTAFFPKIIRCNDCSGEVIRPLGPLVYYGILNILGDIYIVKFIQIKNEMEIMRLV